MSPSSASLPRPSGKTLLAFALFVIVSGGASVAIRFTYAEMPPFWSAGSRFVLGAAFFWSVVLLRRLPLPRGRALLGSVLFGVFSMGLSFLFIYWGLVETPASLYQTIVALVPLLPILLAAAQGLEPLRARGLLGAGLTVLGIVVAVGGAAADGLAPLRVIAIVLGAACFAEAGIVAKRFPRNDPFVTNAIAMPVGAAILLAASWINGERWVVPRQTSTWLAFGYIVVFVTIVAFLLYLYVLGRWTATGSSYSFVLIPLVTLVLASWLAGERITPQFLTGGTLVVLGVWLGALLPDRSRAA